MLFGGAAAEPYRLSVVTWAPLTLPDGRTVKEIVSSAEFTTYLVAKSYMDSLGPGNHVLVGRHPLQTCVPLEALPDYRLAYETSDRGTRPTGNGSVRVFEVRTAR
jgi:hypothetical protein